MAFQPAFKELAFLQFPFAAGIGADRGPFAEFRFQFHRQGFAFFDKGGQCFLRDHGFEYREKEQRMEG
jgi:hypothetical protein